MEAVRFYAVNESTEQLNLFVDTNFSLGNISNRSSLQLQTDDCRVCMFALDACELAHRQIQRVFM